MNSQGGKQEKIGQTMEEIESPKPEQSVVQQWYEENPFVSGSGIEIHCVKLHVRTDTVLEYVPTHLHHGIGVFPIHNIIDGPIEVTPLKARKWNIPTFER